MKRARVWTARLLLLCLALALLALAVAVRVYVDNQLVWGGHHPVLGSFVLQIVGAVAVACGGLVALVLLIREAMGDA